MRSLGPMLLLALAALPAAAQTAPRPPACTAPEYRQFDFWVGTWDVILPNGKPAGTNRIEPILGGCALRESWTGGGGGSGTSYNVYDRSAGSSTRPGWTARATCSSSRAPSRTAG